MVTIATRLKALRDDLHLSSRAFAGAVTEAGFPVSHAAVLGYEKEREDGGPESVPGDYLAAVCKAFDVAPAWILTGIGPRKQPAQDADGYGAAWREAAAELRALAESFDKRAGKAPGPDEEPGEGEPTGPSPGEGPPPTVRDAVDRHLKRRQSPGGTGTDG